MNDFPDLRVGYIVNFSSDLVDDYNVIYKISYLDGAPYRVFFVDNDGETWYIKIGDITGLFKIECPTPSGNVQIWPGVDE